ncbi:hypothetical protein GCM10023091_41950 [Ravibacter arvi]|uniref:Uncharacterized protein n=1 Tax=Ravibacter arvi TaxID=2051041 RepID=A0ABP8MA98_9BACT
MSNIKKAGMLIVLLALPAFFFVFLKLFGSNHYDLPYFHPLRDPGNRVLMNGADTVYYALSEPLGRTGAGDTLTAGVLESHINLFLLPARLEGTGERRVAAVERLEERLKDVADVQLFVLDTPGRDTLASAQFPGLAVTSLQLSAPAWTTLLKLDNLSTVEGTLTHATSLVLVDGKRHIRGYYDVLNPDDFDRVLAEVKILAYQKKMAAKK